MAQPLGANAAMKYITSIDEQQFSIEILDEEHILVDGQPFNVDFEAVGDQPVYSLLINGHSYEAYIYPSDEGWQVLLLGRLYPAVVIDEREKRLLESAGGRVMESAEYHLKAPMPGLIVSVPVSEGQKVEKGDVLVILESMKMQNELKAPRDGTVTRLRVKSGDNVEQKQTLLSVA
jgi:acetyl/propionyl-CoA carboxylase alpha subunit